MKDDSRTGNSIDDAIASIKADLPSAAEIAAASERARASIAANRGPQEVVTQELGSTASDDSWNSVDDYITAIPAFLAKQLTPAQTLLFEEESRQSIPLRRALNEARGQNSNRAQHVAEANGQRSSGYRWFAAAAVVAMVAIALITAVPELPSFDQSRLAQVEKIDGQLYQITNGRLESLSAGTWIDGRQRIRSASGSTAIITLDDGSQIEVDERSELSMTRRGSGNRIDVSRGRILVAASPQGSGTLDVFTNEFMVSVTGTIFEVAHGTKGSRVAVVEGEVNVLLQGNTTSLTPGQAMASRMDSLTLNVEDEIAWSQDADLYIDMLNEVAALQQDLEAVLATQPRYSTRLLDLAPANTSVYIAVPNAPEKIAEVYDVIRARMESSQFLAAAWAEFEANSEAQYLDETMSWLREIGYALGEETVLAISMQTQTNEGVAETIAVPVVLSEVDAAVFAATFEQQIQRIRDVLAAEGHDADLEIALIADPSEAADGQLSIWLHEDILVASIDAGVLSDMQSIVENQTGGFVGTELHGLLQNSYDQGTEILGAVNIGSLLAPHDIPDSGLQEVGLANAEYLVAQHQLRDGATHITADLFFAGETQGVMSWLSTPGPMGSLEFFSVDSTMAAAFLLREPISIVSELEQMVELDDIQATAEFELFNSVLSVLGGDVAIGLDGPALPTPAWKVVIEAYDASQLQESIELSAARFNEYAAENAMGAAISISSADVGGFSGYQVSLAVDPAVSSDFDAASFHYAYVDGYLVAAPDAGLVDRAISYYESGSSLQTDSEFRELLSRDGYLDFSAVYFSRVGELVNDVLQNLPSNLSAEQQAAISALDTDIGPSLTSVLALSDKIHFAYTGSSQFPVQLFSQLMALRPVMESMTEQEQVQ